MFNRSIVLALNFILILVVDDCVVLVYSQIERVEARGAEYVPEMFLLEVRLQSLQSPLLQYMRADRTTLYLETADGQRLSFSFLEQQQQQQQQLLQLQAQSSQQLLSYGASKRGVIGGGGGAARSVGLLGSNSLSPNSVPINETLRLLVPAHTLRPPESLPSPISTAGTAADHFAFVTLHAALVDASRDGGRSANDDDVALCHRAPLALSALMQQQDTGRGVVPRVKPLPEEVEAQLPLPPLQGTWELQLISLGPVTAISPIDAAAPAAPVDGSRGGHHALSVKFTTSFLDADGRLIKQPQVQSQSKSASSSSPAADAIFYRSAAADFAQLVAQPSFPKSATVGSTNPASAAGLHVVWAEGSPDTASNPNAAAVFSSPGSGRGSGGSGGSGGGAGEELGSLAPAHAQYVLVQVWLEGDSISASDATTASAAEQGSSSGGRVSSSRSDKSADGSRNHHRKQLQSPSRSSSSSSRRLGQDWGATATCVGEVVIPILCAVPVASLRRPSATAAVGSGRAVAGTGSDSHHSLFLQPPCSTSIDGSSGSTSRHSGLPSASASALLLGATSPQAQTAHSQQQLVLTYRFVVTSPDGASAPGSTSHSAAARRSSSSSRISASTGSSADKGSGGGGGTPRVSVKVAASLKPLQSSDCAWPCRVIAPSNPDAIVTGSAGNAAGVADASFLYFHVTQSCLHIFERPSGSGSSGSEGTEAVPPVALGCGVATHPQVVSVLRDCLERSMRSRDSNSRLHLVVPLAQLCATDLFVLSDHALALSLTLHRIFSQPNRMQADGGAGARVVREMQLEVVVAPCLAIELFSCLRCRLGLAPVRNTLAQYVAGATAAGASGSSLGLGRSAQGNGQIKGHVKPPVTFDAVASTLQHKLYNSITSLDKEFKNMPTSSGKNGSSSSSVLWVSKNYLCLRLLFMKHALLRMYLWFLVEHQAATNTSADVTHGGLLPPAPALLGSSPAGMPSVGVLSGLSTASLASWQVFDEFSPSNLALLRGVDYDAAGTDPEAEAEAEREVFTDFTALRRRVELLMHGLVGDVRAAIFRHYHQQQQLLAGNSGGGGGGGGRFGPGGRVPLEERLSDLIHDRFLTVLYYLSKSLHAEDEHVRELAAAKRGLGGGEGGGGDDDDDDDSDLDEGADGFDSFPASPVAGAGGQGVEKLYSSANPQRQRDLLGFIIAQEGAFEAQLTPLLRCHGLQYSAAAPPLLSLCIDYDALIDSFSELVDESIVQWSTRTLAHFMRETSKQPQGQPQGQEEYTPWEITTMRVEASEMSGASGAELFISRIPETVQTQLNVEIELKKLAAPKPALRTRCLTLAGADAAETVDTAEQQLLLDEGDEDEGAEDALAEALATLAKRRVQRMNLQVAAAVAKVFRALAGEYEAAVQRSVQSLVVLSVDGGNGGRASGRGGRGGGGGSVDVVGSGPTALGERKDELLCFLLSVANDCQRINDRHIPSSVASFADPAALELRQARRARRQAREQQRLKQRQLLQQHVGSTETFSEEGGDVASSGSSSALQEDEEYDDEHDDEEFEDEDEQRCNLHFIAASRAVDAVSMLALHEMANQMFLHSELRDYFLGAFDRHILISDTARRRFLRWRGAGVGAEGSAAVTAAATAAAASMTSCADGVEAKEDESEGAATADSGPTQQLHQQQHSPVEVICATLSEFLAFVGKHLNVDDIERLLYICVKKVVLRYMVFLRDLLLKLPPAAVAAANAAANASAGGSGAPPTTPPPRRGVLGWLLGSGGSMDSGTRERSETESSSVPKASPGHGNGQVEAEVEAGYGSSAGTGYAVEMSRASPLQPAQVAQVKLDVKHVIRMHSILKLRMMSAGVEGGGAGENGGGRCGGKRGGRGGGAGESEEKEADENGELEDEEEQERARYREFYNNSAANLFGVVSDAANRVITGETTDAAVLDAVIADTFSMQVTGG